MGYEGLHPYICSKGRKCNQSDFWVKYMHVLLQAGSISEKQELYPLSEQQLPNYYVSDFQKSPESTNKKAFLSPHK